MRLLIASEGCGVAKNEKWFRGRDLRICGKMQVMGLHIIMVTPE